MKPDTHPKYYQAQVHCASCGTEFTDGYTTEELRVDICSNCHPFYTGKQTIVDTAGQVERIQKRLERSSKLSRPARHLDPVSRSDGRNHIHHPLLDQSHLLVEQGKQIGRKLNSVRVLRLHVLRMLSIRLRFVFMMLMTGSQNKLGETEEDGKDDQGNLFQQRHRVTPQM